MSDTILQDIIRLCLDGDEKAAKAYHHLANFAENDSLSTFWKGMAAEEMEHASYWRGLDEMAGKSMLPQIFENPEQTRRELEEISCKVDDLLARCEDAPNVSNAFLLAYRLEFYLLHPAFHTLFHYMTTMGKEDVPQEAYESHLEKFIEMLRQHGDSTPELDLLGETLQRLWKRNMELARQSATDELTGLLNRRGFLNAAKPFAHLSQRQMLPLGVMMADIDNFKLVNDTHGHPMGDRVLQAVSAVIRNNIRISDVGGRYGGEEFIVLFSALEKDTGREIAEKIRRLVEQETKAVLPVTISIGVAEAVMDTDPEQDLMRLIDEADKCLYVAKETGKNKVVSGPCGANKGLE